MLYLLKSAPVSRHAVFNTYVHSTSALDADSWRMGGGSDENSQWRQNMSNLGANMIDIVCALSFVQIIPTGKHACSVSWVLRKGAPIKRQNMDGWQLILNGFGF